MMLFLYLVVLLFGVAAPGMHVQRRLDRIPLPLSTSGRDIVDKDGKVFHYLATNWPGHQETMIPEGLQHASIEDIVSWISKFGLNSVRVTFAIEMVDDIISNNPNQTLEKSFHNALGQVNGTEVLGQILQHNPQFTKDTTRIQVWDAIAKELARQNIIMHLDNHVSKAIWCCGENDGNGWFGEKYFNVQNWTRAWGWIAKHGAENWPSFASVGLRNELRKAAVAEPVDWYTWHTHMTAAATAVHNSNANVLIFFSGMDYDTWIYPIPLGQTLNGTKGTSTEGKTVTFDPTKFAFKNKIVLELHKYDFEATQDNCTTFKSKFYQQGFQAVDKSNSQTKYLFPLVLSEWGFIQDGVYWNKTTYNKCLIEMVHDWKISWMQWELSGSFYLQTKASRVPPTIQGLEEFWGLLDYNWSAVRSPITVQNSLDKMMDAVRKPPKCKRG